MIQIVLYTLKIAFFSTLLAAAIGIPIAFYTSQRDFFGKKIILASSAVPLCVPPLIIALGYVGFFGVSGIANTILKLAGINFFSNKSFLYSAAGIIIAQGFYNFPLITKIVNDAWLLLPQEQQNAARLLGAGEKKVFWTITIKQLSGAIAAACIPVFLFCFFSFMIVLLFSPVGKSTIEVELYHSIRTTLDVKTGTTLAVTETAIALIIVFLYSYLCRGSQKSGEGLSYLWKSKKKTKIGKAVFETKMQSFVEITIFCILILIIFIFFFCPGISIIISSFLQRKSNRNQFTFFQFIKLFSEKNYLKSLLNTFWVAATTSLICCIIGFFYSALVKINKKQSSIIFQIVPLIPMAISSVVLAWCFGMVFHRGNPIILIITQTLIYWPIAYRQLQNGINKIERDVERAALIYSKNKFDVIKRIYFPACRKVILSSFGFCFAVSAGDSTLPLVLAIPRFNTMALYTYKLASSYKFNQACASGVIVALLCGSIFILCDYFAKKE